MVARSALAPSWPLIGQYSEYLDPDWLSHGKPHLAKIGSQESNSLMTCACGCDVKLALFIVLLITSFICLKQDEVFWALEDLSQQDEF